MWNKLLKVALLGTDRTELDLSLLAELEANGIDTSQVPEKVLADALAYHGILHKTAAHLKEFTGSLPPPVKEDVSSVCSPKSSRHLRLILDGDFGFALAEFIENLQITQKSLPPESLPALFDRCLTEPDLWSRIEGAIGSRGHWLLQQNPAWSPLYPQVDPDTWPQAESEERLIIIRELRKRDPKRAIPLLENIWSEIEHREKAAFLKLLQTGLSNEDENFLEKCLDDGRKPVRKQAAALLCQIPDSALSIRLFEEAEKMLQYEQGKLKIEPPTKLAKSLQRDGIETKSREYTRASQADIWFLQMVERIPPALWAKQYEIEVSDFITLAKRADKTKNFMKSLAQAALLHQDSDWLTALVQNWAIEQDERMWNSSLGKEVLTALPETAANRIAIQYLERNEYLLDEHSLANQLLFLGVHAWEDRLALLLIKGFQNWIANASSFFGNMWHYKRLLKVAAFRSNPELILKFQSGWHPQSRIWGIWEKDIEHFMRSLHFRKEMIGELREKRS
jgi:hypothetical protein